MWTVLLFIPILNWFSNWHHSSEFAVSGNDKYPALVMSLAWAVFVPIVWILVQMDLNKAASTA